jgi:hypothetical protein
LSLDLSSWQAEGLQALHGWASWSSWASRHFFFIWIVFACFHLQITDN